VTDRRPASPGAGERLRVAVVWTELSGYLAACLRALEERHDVDLAVVSDLGNRPESTRRAYDDSLFDWIPRFRRVRNPDAGVRFAEIGEVVFPHRPHLLLMSFQWRYPEFYRLASRARKMGIACVGAMDNNWNGGPRQRLMAGVVRAFHPLRFDAVWVPGERTAQYARRLFGPRTPLWRGVYCADASLFRAPDDGERAARPRTFLYTGRFVPEKGLGDLLEAYARYRGRVAEPWDLLCVGDGPLRPSLENREGIRITGFRQPAQVAELMRREASAFVLPSRFEPWGVVVHEAALSGLPVVCSDAVGASVELVQDGYDGFVYPAGDVEALAGALERAASADVDLRAMGRNAASLAQRYTPDLWARTLVEGFGRLRKGPEGPGAGPGV
jgi:glycosyltransferase involved in cell wall biosynthesis